MAADTRQTQAARSREEAAAEREREAQRVAAEEGRAQRATAEAAAKQEEAKAAAEQAARERRGLEALRKVGALSSQNALSCAPFMGWWVTQRLCALCRQSLLTVIPAVSPVPYSPAQALSSVQSTLDDREAKLLGCWRDLSAQLLALRQEGHSEHGGEHGGSTLGATISVGSFPSTSLKLLAPVCCVSAHTLFACTLALLPSASSLQSSLLLPSSDS